MFRTIRILPARGGAAVIVGARGAAARGALTALALIVVAMVFSAAPLPFSDELGEGAMHVVAAASVVFYFVANENCNCSECPYMKLNTLDKLRDCLRDLTPRVELSADLIRRALAPLERMLAVR